MMGIIHHITLAAAITAEILETDVMGGFFITQG